MGAMNFAVARGNRKLLDSRTNMSFSGLLRRENENSGTTRSSITMNFCGAVPWVMRRQLLCKKKNLVGPVPRFLEMETTSKKTTWILSDPRNTVKNSRTRKTSSIEIDDS